MGKTVLLVMDIQNGIVERHSNNTQYLHRLSSTINTARSSGLQIIHIRTVFRAGDIDASALNKSIAKAVAWGALTEGRHSAEIHDSIKPHAQDIVVNKSRGSAFHGSDLEAVLRSLGREGEGDDRVETLVLMGLSTGGVVLSTVRQAADMDYRLVVLEDLCADGDWEAHDFLMRRIFPKQAEVMSSEEWLAGLRVGV